MKRNYAVLHCDSIIMVDNVENLANLEPYFKFGIIRISFHAGPIATNIRIDDLRRRYPRKSVVDRT